MSKNLVNSRKVQKTIKKNWNRKKRENSKLKTFLIFPSTFADVFSLSHAELKPSVGEIHYGKFALTSFVQDSFVHIIISLSKLEDESNKSNKKIRGEKKLKFKI